MPRASSFLVEDAEAEIRRTTQRHYQMQAEIAELTTDRDQWKNEATLHKAEAERLTERLKDKDANEERLLQVVHTLQAQFEVGAQVWLNGYKTLQSVAQIRVVTPAALEAIEHKRENGD
jgi:chromosome segregation ATPase